MFEANWCAAHPRTATAAFHSVTFQNTFHQKHRRFFCNFKSDGPDKGMDGYSTWATILVPMLMELDATPDDLKRLFRTTAMAAYNIASSAPQVEEVHGRPAVRLRNAVGPGLMPMPVVGLGTGGYGSNASLPPGEYPECWSDGSGPPYGGAAQCKETPMQATRKWLAAGGRRIDSGKTPTT